MRCEWDLEIKPHPEGEDRNYNAKLTYTVTKLYGTETLVTQTVEPGAQQRDHLSGKGRILVYRVVPGRSVRHPRGLFECPE